MGLPPNGAYNFNGINQYLYHLDNATLSITGDMSIGCWVNHESIPNIDVYQTYVSKMNQGNNQQSYYLMIL